MPTFCVATHIDGYPRKSYVSPFPITEFYKYAVSNYRHIYEDICDVMYKHPNEEYIEFDVSVYSYGNPDDKLNTQEIDLLAKIFTTALPETDNIRDLLIDALDIVVASECVTIKNDYYEGER